MNILSSFTLYLCLYGTVLSTPIQRKVSYLGYSLIRATPATNLQLQFLLKINSNSSAGIDFWLRTTAINRSADVMISPSAKDFFLSNLEKQEIPYNYLIPDIGKLIEEDMTPVSEDPKTDFMSGFFAQYNRYSKILRFISVLSESYPNFVTALEIGRSFENRPLMLLKISTQGRTEKPAIWIQGGAHAREQIGPAAVAYIALQLIIGDSESEKINKLVDLFDWYLLPVLNPDGYEYSHDMDRLWRKTRSTNHPDSRCVGVDANRNWDFAWSESVGSSRDLCSHNYAGPHPFSEKETRSVSNFMAGRLKGKLILFLDLHSYSQRWLTPWGYTTRLPPNFEAQKELAEIATKAVEKVYGTKYTIGSSARTLYAVSGGARDWVYGVIGAEYSYVVELRDKGNYGFVLNKAQILPTVKETWAGVNAMACELGKRKRSSSESQISTDNQNSTGGYGYGIAVFWKF